MLIKRYPNRKLYNTQAKQYITLEGISELIRQGAEVHVTDYATGEDLTVLTLTQVILEQQKKKGGLLSHTTLTSLIRLGEDRLTAFQRNLSSTVGILHQIDEEIQRRIQVLVSTGELSEIQGKELSKKLLNQSKPSPSRDNNREMLEMPGEQALQKVVQHYQIPTRTDILKLFDQLDELASKLETIANPANSGRIQSLQE